ncbi:MAG: response regulator [Nitrospinae bacterium]|nr:response regulator [Nitrospinota bacterium]
MEFVEFSLTEVLENLSTLITQKAHEKGLEVLFSLDKNVPAYLMGDPLRLGQVLTNLANNAVKFTEQGEVIVAIENIEENKDSVTLKFEVKDSGIGLTQEQMNRLFKSFSQADTTTTRKYGGTGLGLAISKKLVEKMKGDIWVESEVGKGSQFIFTAKFSCPIQKSKKSQGPSKDLEGMHILLVDDNQATLDILQDALESLSFKVSQAVSGEEALDIIDQSQEKPFELIFMDWKMPGLDGIETSKRIKKKTILQPPPKIIMLTAYGGEEIMNQAQELPLDGFLVKPVTPSSLLNAIMEAFGKGDGQKIKTAAKSGSKSELSKDIQGANVLLVEDNEINQEVALEVLEQAGLLVTIANNGQEALDLIKSSDFDCILMDLQMPVMDGYEATRNIRKNTRFKSLPVIAMTANAMSGDKEKCLDAGMNDHVAKPIDPNQLFSALNRWIKPIKNRPLKKVVKSSPSTVNSSSNESIPDLPGINVEKGLSILGGNIQLYKKLLLRLQEDFSDAAQKIKKNLKDNNKEEAEIVAHTVKGVASNLGALELAEIGATLEDSIRNGSKDEIDKNLAAFEKKLNHVTIGLRENGFVDEKNEKQDLDFSRINIPKPFLKDLMKNAKLGMFNEFEKQLEEMGALGNSEKEFANKLRELSQDFNKKEIMELLKKAEK